MEQTEQVEQKNDLTAWLSIKNILQFACFRGKLQWIWTKKVKN